MKRYETVIEMLRDVRSAGRTVRFIDGEDAESIVGFDDLWSRAGRFLGSLQSRGLAPDDELIITTKSNERFLVAYWGAILGGIVPVPVAVGISDEHRQKLFRIGRQLRRPTLFTDAEQLQRLRDFAEKENVRDTATSLLDDAIVDVGGETPGEVQARSPDDIAFIQYSSGSTSDPKGVCLTHRNLVSTIQAQSIALAFDESDRALSWMPLTHDMGLIGYHLTMLASGMDHAIMDTSVFVRRPLLWLSKASELRSTVLCSPNFGYKHYLKMFERKPPAEMDLSCVRLCLNGAEPISIDLCEEFLAALAPYGLNRTAMYPVYGLAEATLAVTFPELGKEYSWIVVKRHSLRIGEPFEATDVDDTDAVKFVKLGTAIDGCEYRIAGDDDAPLDDGCVGNIQLSGENITKGLYEDPDSTRVLFTADGWLRTGDCGVTVDGQLVVTGRAKDIIIVNGQNYYPHDIEEIIAQLDELELGKVVVCGAKRPGIHGEELLVFVLHRKDLESLQPLAGRIRTIVGEHAGLEVDRVIPISRVPKTTSGKLQRSSLANAYLDGEYDALLAEQRKLTREVDDAAGEPDGNPLIADLLAISAEFSKDRKIGPDDNLFEIGLTSLTLTEIMLAVEEKYPGKADINDLFDYPTIRELSGLLKERG